jgi:hypothetical protein
MAAVGRHAMSRRGDVPERGQGSQCGRSEIVRGLDQSCSGALLTLMSTSQQGHCLCAH